jgi:putative lipoprotein
MKGFVLAASFILVLLSAALAQGVGWDGATWLVDDIAGRGVIDNAQTTLSIDPDGKVAGSTGCNRYFGKATFDGAKLRFGPLATTYRACPPALADQESKFLAALREARMARLDPVGRMQITTARGEPLLTLTRM